MAILTILVALLVFNALVSSQDCTGMYTAYIVLDGSESIKMENFDTTKRAINEFVADSLGSNPRNRIGVIVYSDTITSNFTATSNRQSLTYFINSIRYPNSGTSTHRGISLATKHLLDDRVEGTKIMVVITDGLSSQPLNTARDAAFAKSENIRLYAVQSVTYLDNFRDVRDQSESELRMIASPGTALYTIERLNQLAGDLSNVSRALCSPIATITRAMKFRTVLERSSVTMSTVLNQADITTGSWTYLGNSLSSNPKYNIRTAAGVQFLDITSVGLTDGGFYTYGYSTATTGAVLTVIALIDNQTGRFGGTASFETRVSPNQQGQWFKNGVLLTANDRFDIVETNGYRRLTINDLTGSDAGRYTFRVNDVDTSAVLDVRNSIDGGWSLFGDWQPSPNCYGTCGPVDRLWTRQRTCTNPIPTPGGNPCSGESVEMETRPCENSPACPVSTVDGTWGFWSQWTQPVCPVTCGGGNIVRARTRECNSPAPSSGEFCEDPTSNMKRENFKCNEDSCPVINGQWTPFGAWRPEASCPFTCGQTTQVWIRERSCTNPAPSLGGLLCTGQSQEREIRSCADNPECPVNGAWGPWGTWSEKCDEQTCGTFPGLRLRRKECNSPAPNAVGDYCQGEGIRIEAFDCIKAQCADCVGDYTAYVVLDGSESIQLENFEKTKQAINSFVDDSLNRNPTNRIGVIVYSDTVTRNITATSNRQALKESINNIAYPDSGTSTHLGISAASDYLVNDPGQGAKIMVLITDGLSNIPPNTTAEAANAKNRGIIIYAIGVMEYFHEFEGYRAQFDSELESIASASTNVYTTQNFDQLVGLLSGPSGISTSLSSASRVLCSQIVSITNPMIDRTVLERSTITMSATLNKMGITDGTWTYQGNPLSPSPRHNIRVTGRVQNLDITNVGLIDGGIYRYTHSVVSTVAVLTVLALMGNQTANAGESTTFETRISPNQEGQWLKNGVLLDTLNGKYEHFKSQGYRRLTINHLTASDAGQYAFRVNNVDTSAFLNVLHSTEAAQSYPIINGQWTPFGAWRPESSCPFTCGQTTQVWIRERSCTNPAPSLEGLLCTGQSQEREIRSCADNPECPVNGAWGPWGAWAEICDEQTCGTFPGRRLRRKECNSPAPNAVGDFCEGESFQIEAFDCIKAQCAECLNEYTAYIVLDGSNSVGSANFETIKQSVNNFVDDNLNRNPNNRFGVIVYSDKVTENITATSIKGALLAAINSISYPDGGTATHLGIASATAHLVEDSFENTKIMIVITDGLSGQPPLTAAAAEFAKRKGIMVFAVGFTATVTDFEDHLQQFNDELRSIASNNTEPYTIDNFNGLSALLANVSRALCNHAGVWSMWGPWSDTPCPVTCGKEAVRPSTRTRTCLSGSPPTSDCRGPTSEEGHLSCGLTSECPGSSGYTYVIVGVVCGAVLLLVLVVFAVFICKIRSNGSTMEGHQSVPANKPPVYDNPMYSDLNGTSPGPANKPPVYDNPMYPDLNGPSPGPANKPPVYDNPMYPDLNGPSPGPANKPPVYDNPMYPDLNGPSPGPANKPPVYDNPMYPDLNGTSPGPPTLSQSDRANGHVDVIEDPPNKFRL